MFLHGAILKYANTGNGLDRSGLDQLNGLNKLSEINYRLSEINYSSVYLSTSEIYKYVTFFFEFWTSCTIANIQTDGDSYTNYNIITIADIPTDHDSCTSWHRITDIKVAGM